MKNRVKELRLARRLTLRELAEKIDLDHSAVSRIENGGRNLSDNDIIKLCNVFNVSADYLLCNTNNKKIHDVIIMEEDGTITELQHEIIDAIKGLEPEEVQEVCNYINYLKSKKGYK